MNVQKVFHLKISLPAALFTLWLLVIAAMAWLMEKPGHADQDD